MQVILFTMVNGHDWGKPISQIFFFSKSFTEKNVLFWQQWVTVDIYWHTAWEINSVHPYICLSVIRLLPVIVLKFLCATMHWGKILLLVPYQSEILVYSWGNLNSLRIERSILFSFWGPHFPGLQMVGQFREGKEDQCKRQALFANHGSEYTLPMTFTCVLWYSTITIFENRICTIIVSLISIECLYDQCI